MALTKNQVRLIAYPPTPETWECLATDRVDEEGNKITCHTYNAGSKHECWVCRKPRRKNRLRKPWQEYMEACWEAARAEDRARRRGTA